MDNKIYVEIMLIAFPAACGIAIYFIKDIMNNHKKHGEKIIDIEKNYVKKEELEQKHRELKIELNNGIKEQIGNVKDDIKEIRVEFSDSNNKTLKAVEKLSQEVNDIKVNYISKDDFLKQNTLLSNKMDKLMDMMYEEKAKSAKN
ncbi:hypothetical protein [Peptoanaerobacter stomatis]|uniref:hypothetical protein n=1 Tax=Peptoanaerobacter stomatis TaxID=796937 RepID=UPI003FA14FBE